MTQEEIDNLKIGDKVHEKYDKFMKIHRVRNPKIKCPILDYDSVLLEYGDVSEYIRQTILSILDGS